MNKALIGESYRSAGYWENKNIYSYLHDATKENPKKVAVIDSNQNLTYEELNMKVKKFAEGLKQLGVKRGDVVSFQLPNWYETVIIHQAVAMIGAISNPIIPIYRNNELTYILERSNSKVLIIPHTFRDFSYKNMIQEIMNETVLNHLEKVLIVDKYDEKPLLNEETEEEFNAFIDRHSENEEIVEVKETDVALLLYTSGTTAEPKGVLHSHNTLLFENKTFIDLYDLNENDVLFMPTPVTHITGLLYGLELPFMIKASVVFHDIWNPQKAIQEMIKENCTWTIGATPFLKGILESLTEDDKNKLKLKAFPCGGADVPPSLIKKGTELLNCYVTRVYGSSEYPTLTACNETDPLEKAAYTDGRLLEGAKAKIVDEGGVELSYGEVGELAVKGPEMFLGYLQEELNSDAFLPDGYFLTGDLATIDEKGYIQIRGRKKDIIIRNGENISVMEVENLLYEHPHIKQVAIVAMPDAITGEKACAYVVPENNVSLDLNDICNYLMEKNIARQKHPEHLELIDKLPMTASGKVQKYILKERIRKKVQES